MGLAGLVYLDKVMPVEMGLVMLVPQPHTEAAEAVVLELLG